MNAYVGTGALVRLALRRDRIMLPAWIAGLVLLAASSAAAAAGLFPDAEARVRSAETANNTPALLALYGRIYDTSSLGGISMIKTGSIGAVLIALLSIIIVVRHTRADEEAGRTELVGATVVGRSAPLTAALAIAVGTNVVLGVFTAFGLVAAGLPSAGSYAFGAAWMGVGIAFAAIAAVTGQLVSTARSATAMGSVVLGVVYVFRAVGDTAGSDGPTWMTWLSPIGWGQQFRPFAGERWWVLLITLGFAVVVTAGAYALVERRDIGAGLLPDRLGPATGARSLRSPLALAWRLQRGSLLGWAVAFAGLGFLLGNIASNIGGMLEGPAKDIITKIGGQQQLGDAFLSIEMGVMGLIISAYGIQAALRLRSEETGQRAEPLLAASASRISWASSHLAVALGGSTLILAATGATAGLSYAAQTGDSAQFGRVFGSAVVQLPAVWVIIGVVVLAFGLVPRLVAAGWVALALSLLLGQLGSTLNLPQWAMDLSPFTHTPKFPASEIDPVPLVWLTVVAAALIAAGLVAFRRRDITS
jgi:ABC-2 type transport system permease protein